MNSQIPVVGFAAYSGTGKTTLLVKLLPILKARGVRVGMVKHAHHNFDVDKPGKDSYELRKAGAAQMLVASRRRWVLMVESEPEHEPRLRELLLRLDRGSLDVILVEGFKGEPLPKIELHRPALNTPLIYPDDSSVIAVATDGELPVPTQLPVLDINDPRAMADFICERFVNA